MATLQLLPPSFLQHPPHSLAPRLLNHVKFYTIYLIFSLKPGNCGKLSSPESSNKETSSTAAEQPKPTRRGRKKSTSTDNTPPSSTKIAKRPRKTAELTTSDVEKEAAVITEDDVIDDELYDYDDGIDFPYEDPPLICCFGAAQWEFVPTVRVAPEEMHPDIYSQWKMLQWNPPEFARAPGGPPSNVAISHVRLGGRAAFIGKVGNDELGEELVLMMNKEKVQTRGVKFDANASTACTYMKIKFEDGKMKVEKVKDAHRV